MAGDESRLLTLLRTTLKQKVDMRRQLAMRGSPRDLHKKYGQISDAVGVRSMRGRPPRLRDGLCLRAVYWSYIEPKHQELTVDLRMPIMGFACSPPGSDHADQSMFGRPARFRDLQHLRAARPMPPQNRFRLHHLSQIELPGTQSEAVRAAMQY
jgi:hypothetical protein